MTHFPVEEKEDVKMGLAQFKLDSQWLLEAGKLDRSKITIHAANSFATLEVPDAYFDMVRRAACCTVTPSLLHRVQAGNGVQDPGCLRQPLPGRQHRRL